MARAEHVLLLFVAEVALFELLDLELITARNFVLAGNPFVEL